ncbi:MAG: DUF1015 domain-containing protein [Dorea sp.]|nr:DUF1015 domain-containing protein [Dorea sp.]
MAIFKKTDILFPQVEDLSKWSVIACDQFTSQPEYWEAVKEYAGDAPSTLNMIFPEAWLGQDEASRIAFINETMKKYESQNIFKTYQDAFIYVERTLVDGTIRKGIVGAIDLDAYDYSDGAKSDVRATEKTVVERIPPRKRIRQHATLELPHVILLADDAEKILVESVEAVKDTLPVIYDLDLMQGGGHLTGWLVDGEESLRFEEQLEKYYVYIDELSAHYNEVPMYFAMGDGNHSLATAKACYEDIKAAYIAEGREDELADHPARYALVEIENLHDDAQQFEAIHRVVKLSDVNALADDLKQSIGVASGGYEIVIHTKDGSETVMLDPAKGQLSVGILQDYLDTYLAEHGGQIDYIHGADTLKNLCKKEGVIGFELPSIEKESFFVSIVLDGVLPRKTFSMGHACEKRYYMEARKIQK